MRTGKKHFIFIAACCCLLITPGVLSISAGGDATAEILARVSLIAYDVTASGITAGTADITWMTNGQTNSTVEYGLTVPYDFSKSGPEMVASHNITLEGLSASTLYHYRVVSSDPSGTTCTSPDFTFTTDSMKMANAKILGGMPAVEFLASPTIVMVDSGNEIVLTADNLVREPVEVVSGDRSATLSIDPDTRIIDRYGQPVNRIGLIRISRGEVPGEERSPFVFTGYAYRVEPSGATFTPPLALRITPSPGDWKQISGNELLIRYYNPVSGNWEPLSMTTDPSTHTVTSMIASASDFGLFSGPALSVSPASTISQAGMAEEVPGGINHPVIVFEAPDLLIIFVAVTSMVLYFSRKHMH